MFIDDILAKDILKRRKARAVLGQPLAQTLSETKMQTFLRDLPPAVWLPLWSFGKCVDKVIPPGRPGPLTLTALADSAGPATAIVNVLSIMLWLDVLKLSLLLLTLLIL